MLYEDRIRCFSVVAPISTGTGDFRVYNYLTVEVNKGELHAEMWKVKDPLPAEPSVEPKDQFTRTVPGRKAATKSRAHPQPR